MKRAVYLSDRFHSCPEVLRAKHRDFASIGLFVWSLCEIAQLHYLEEYDRVCTPLYDIQSFLEESGLRPRRPIMALVDAGLWKPLHQNQSKRIVAYEPQGRGRLWRIGSFREPISTALRREVLERDQGICGICKGHIYEEETPHIDHIIPVAHGGRSRLDNLQAAHAKCNISKGARLDA